MSTLILGIGNIIMGDDGFGPHVVERLRCRHCFPYGVELVDGGTGGLELLPCLKGVRNLVVIDAVELGEEPGMLRRLTGEDVPAVMGSRLSPHQLGFPDLLTAAAMAGDIPERIVLWGVQPGRIEPTLTMTDAVAAQVESVVTNVLDELDQLGIRPLS